MRIYLLDWPLIRRRATAILVLGALGFLVAMAAVG
jgi:preprotein translocase subunit Sss1